MEWVGIEEVSSRKIRGQWLRFRYLCIPSSGERFPRIIYCRTKEALEKLIERWGNPYYRYILLKGRPRSMNPDEVRQDQGGRLKIQIYEPNTRVEYIQ